jgi:hypothetical protein
MELKKESQASRREDDTTKGLHNRKKLKIQIVLTTAPLARHNSKPKTQTKSGYQGYHFYAFHGY